MNALSANISSPYRIDLGIHGLFRLVDVLLVAIYCAVHNGLFSAAFASLILNTRIALPWWLALVGFVLCSCLLPDGWFKAWGKYSGLVVSKELCCLGVICLRWIKQRQLMKSVYVHVLIALSYLLLWSLPEIHYAILG